MDYNIEKIQNGTKINFTLSKQEWDSFVERVYQKKKSGINIAGFRKGHAPRHLIEKMYGKSVFFDDAFDICFRECYTKALTENPDVYPVEEPKVDVESIEETVKFSAEFAVKPEITLGQYTGLCIDKVEYKVTKNDIDKEIEKTRERLSRKISKDTEIENGDIINLDYSGSINGENFDGGTAQKQELVIGSNSFIPGFEAQLIGLKKGETKDINVKFPEDYQAEQLKGKDAVFCCTINEVFTKELPAVDDQLAKEGSAFETLDEYKNDIQKQLESANDNKAKTETENNLIKQIVQNATVSIPDAMVETELNYMLEDFSYRLMYMYGGMKLDDYFKYTGSSVEQYKKENRKEAENNVKTRLTLERIIKDEKIEVTDEDYDNELKIEAEKAKKTTEEFVKSMQKGQEQYIRNGLISKKLIQFLMESNKIEAKAVKATKKTTKTETNVK